MKNTIRLTALLATGVLCFGAAAQTKTDAKKKSPAAASAMAAPKPAPEMKDLRDMIGTWTTDESYEVTPMMPNGGTGMGTNTVRPGPGGFSVIMDQRTKTAGTTMSGHAILTWDPNDKSYKLYWADSSMPGVMIETGHKEGDSVAYSGEFTMSGKKIKTRDVISDRTPTSYTLTSYMDDGSGEKKIMTLKATKQEPSASASKK